MRIPGVGPKKAMMFYKKLGIKNIKQLKKAAEQGKLKSLPLFKERAEQKVLEGIKIKKAQKGLMTLKQAQDIANPILKQLRKFPEVQQAIATGSVRRKKPAIGDIDLAVKTNNPEKVINKFTKMPFVKKVLGKGKKKAIVILKQGVQSDLRAATPEEYGATVLYFTGDKQHDIWLRKNAIKKGLKLNEYGLFDKRTGKRLAGRTEASIYKALGIKMHSPEKRIGEVK